MTHSKLKNEQAIYGELRVFSNYEGKCGAISPTGGNAPRVLKV
jgi:hypothetical protein